MKSDHPGPHASLPVSDHAGPRVPLHVLLLSFFKLGGISVGGASASYMQREFVHNRRWLRQEDYLEALMLGRILPGSVGVGAGAFLAHMLHSSRGAALALVIYVVPGLVCAIAFSLLFFGVERPPWANGAVRGLTAGALAVFLLAIVQGSVSASRKARLGPLAAVATFIAYGVLHFDFVMVLFSLGAISVLVNLPGRKKKERA